MKTIILSIAITLLTILNVNSQDLVKYSSTTVATFNRSYNETIEVTGFDQATMTVTEILNSISVNIEHDSSHLVSISIKAPNGKSIFLFNRTDNDFLTNKLRNEYTFVENNTENSNYPTYLEGLTNFGQYLPAVTYSTVTDFSNLLTTSINGLWKITIVNLGDTRVPGIIYGWSLTFDRSKISTTTDNEIVNVSNNKVEVYPNPTKDIINITNSNNNTLLNSLGQVVLTTTDSKIDMSNLVNGIYFVKTAKEIKKIVKE